MLPCLFVSLVASISPRLRAAQADHSDCRTPTPQADMSRSACDDHFAVNVAQAAALQGLTQGPAAQDRQHLRPVQKAWVTWRTADCAFETGGDSGDSGGTLRELARWGSAATLKREHTGAPDKAKEYSESNIACPGRQL